MKISSTVTIPEGEIKWVAIRASGPGGQNVNKVSTAIQLFFDIKASSLPEEIKERLLSLPDNRISSEGSVIIKAQSHRSREKNRAEATERLQALIRSVLAARKKRRPTKPKASSRQKRLDHKKHHSRNKALRRRVRPD